MTNRATARPTSRPTANPPQTHLRPTSDPPQTHLTTQIRKVECATVFLHAFYGGVDCATRIQIDLDVAIHCATHCTTHLKPTTRPTSDPPQTHLRPTSTHDRPTSDPPQTHLRPTSDPPQTHLRPTSDPHRFRALHRQSHGTSNSPPTDLGFRPFLQNSSLGRNVLSPKGARETARCGMAKLGFLGNGSTADREFQFLC
jgi:hypothetical protein